MARFRGLGLKSPVIRYALIICAAAALTILSSFDLSQLTGEITQFIDLAAAKSSGMDADAALIQCRSLLAQRRTDELYRVSRSYFYKFRTPEFRYLYGYGCSAYYYDHHDRSALFEAERLFREYVNELPYDPRGHNRLGWCLSHIGRRKEALGEFLKALELDPDNSFALSKLKYVQGPAACQPAPRSARTKANR